MVAGKSSGGYKYLVLIVCGLFLAFVYVALSSWGVCVPVFAELFNLSTPQVTAGSALLLAGYSVGNFIEGRLMQKWGWKKVFILAMVLFIIPVFLIPVIKNYVVILVLRFFQGFGLVVTITNFLVCGWFPIRQRGLASGILLGAIAGGVALGSALTGWITPTFGWQANFYILGVIILIGSVIFLAVIKNPPDAPEEEEASDAGGSAAIALKPGQSIFAHPIMILLGLAMFCVFFNGYGMYSFIAAFLYDMGYTESQVAAITFWNGIIGVASTPIGGWIGDALIRKGVSVIRARAYSMALVAFLVGTAGCLLMPHMASVSYTFAIIPALIAGWGVPAANAPICALPVDIFGAAKGGGAVGFILLIAGAGGVVAPILVPWIAQVGGWTIAWYITALAAAIGMVICLITPLLVSARKKGAA